jgi:glucokinase
MHILSGDIGGTKARFQLSNYENGDLQCIGMKRYSSHEYNNIIAFIEHFMNELGESISCIEAACFAVAGPILNGCVQLTNLPWSISESRVSKALNINTVRLLNDFCAAGYGVSTLSNDQLCTLQSGNFQQDAPKAIIGAGTGLGVAVITHSDEHGYKVISTEGGHVDFAPTDDVQMELLAYLRKKYHRVSSERVLSGRGLVNIYRFVRDSFIFSETENSDLRYQITVGDPAAVIYKFAAEHQDPLALKALKIFTHVYAAQVGNLALTILPFGGLYIAGGIAPKILPELTSDIFYKRFLDKGRMSKLLTHVPLHIVLDPSVELKGAAMYVAQLVSFELNKARLHCD